MKLFAPEYYKKFKCIADKCKHSCCIGWEIDVDIDTMEKYVSLSSGYGKQIIKSINMEETPHFRLCEDDRCPHLDENGLCRIITNCGESYLCHICREHPRFYNETNYGKEVGVGLSCEEAARLVLSSDGYRNIEVIGDVEGNTEELYFDAVKEREFVYSIISDRSVPYPERLKRLSEKYGISLSCVSKEKIDSLEYLGEAHREKFLCFSQAFETPTALEVYLERALAYFVYRHCTQAYDREEFVEFLGFCLFCERMTASIVHLCESIFEAARIVSEEIEYSEDNTETIKSIFNY